MRGLGGDDTDPGDPIDIMAGEVTDDDGECIPGECISGGEGCEDVGIDCMLGLQKYDPGGDAMFNWDRSGLMSGGEFMEFMVIIPPDPVFMQPDALLTLLSRESISEWSILA